MIGGNPASRGTEASAEVLVGPPGRGRIVVSNTFSGGRITSASDKQERTRQ